MIILLRTSRTVLLRCLVFVSLQKLTKSFQKYESKKRTLQPKITFLCLSVVHVLYYIVEASRYAAQGKF